MLYPDFKNEDTQQDSKDVVEAILKFDLKTQLKLFAIKKYWNAKKFQMIKKLQLLDDIETKYFEKTKVILDESNKIISWETLPKQIQYKNLEKYFTPDEISKKNELIDKSLPVKDYWLKCLKNCEISNLVLPVDYDALSNLKKINISMNSSGFPYKHYTLEFEFAVNKYFSNTLLRKHYEILPDDLIMAKKGDTINWYPGNNITLKNPSQEVDFNTFNTGNKKCYSFYSKSFFLLFLDINSETENKFEEAYLKNQNLIGAEILGEVAPYSLEYHLNVIAKRNDGEEEENDSNYSSEISESDEDEQEEDSKKVLRKKRNSED